MKQLLLILAITVVYFLTLFAQETQEVSENEKFIQINTEFKPYLEGGYFLTTDVALTGGIGFYRNGGVEKTYFMIKGGINKFIKTIGHLRIYTGGAFSYEANPDAVDRGPYESLVVLSGHAGGWINLTNQIHLDGKIGLNLDFTGKDNNTNNNDDNSVNFGFMTSSIGIVISF